MFGIDISKIPDLFMFNPDDPLLFGSSLFLFLFFALLIFYRIFAKSNNARILVLITFSLYFYYMAGGLFVVLLIVNAILNFYFGKWMGATNLDSKRCNFLSRL